MTQQTEGTLVLTSPDGDSYALPESMLAAFAIGGEEPIVVGGPNGRLYAIPRAALDRFAIPAERSEVQGYNGGMGCPTMGYTPAMGVWLCGPIISDGSSGYFTGPATFQPMAPQPSIGPWSSNWFNLTVPASWRH